MHDMNWVLPAEHPDDRVRHVMDAARVSRPTALVLAQRGIAPEDVEAFLNPTLKTLGDPFRIPGTHRAAERLWRAVHHGERILIHGDYDVDGITASVLLASVLRENGADVTCFLPHRIDDGYGLTAESIAKAARDGQRLLVTVDCGITSHEAARAAADMGMDVIITDHHEPEATLPTAYAIVNPKLGDDLVETRMLSGVGVAFKLCHAFLKHRHESEFDDSETDLRQALDLVALGTVADIVPLAHENRTLVRYGLGVLSRQQRPGIRALCEVAGIDGALRAADITFRMAPRLNAAGRMGDPHLALDLLQTRSMSEALKLARKLDEYNRARQEVEEQTVAAAESQIRARCDLAEDRSIVVWAADWHQGVIGIVASRLARRYHRPCIVLTRDTGGFYTGSGRGIHNLNLLNLMERCRACLVRFGGHAMAAGLSLEESRIPEFQQVFEAAAREVLEAEAMRPRLDICGRVDLAEIGDDFFGELEGLEPFGHGNPEPVFLGKNLWPERCGPAGDAHSRGTLCEHGNGRLDFICFGRLPETLPPPPWDVVFAPQLNRFAGRCVPQARVLDIRTAGAPP